MDQAAVVTHAMNEGDIAVYREAVGRGGATIADAITKEGREGESPLPS
jgi:hypothetical protein